MVVASTRRRAAPRAGRRRRRAARRTTRAVVDALAALPRRQREVLALRYYLDLSEREIAETLGISPGAVKSHASRGAAALRRPCPASSRRTHEPTTTAPALPAARRRLRRAPRGRSRAIARRTGRPAATRWLPLTVAAAAAVVLVIGGTAWLARQPPGPRPPVARPSRTDPRPRRRSRAGRAPGTCPSTTWATPPPGRGCSGGPPGPGHDRDRLQVAVNEALTGTPTTPTTSAAWPLRRRRPRPASDERDQHRPRRGRSTGPGTSTPGRRELLAAGAGVGRRRGARARTMPVKLPGRRRGRRDRPRRRRLRPVAAGQRRLRPVHRSRSTPRRRARRCRRTSRSAAAPPPSRPTSSGSSSGAARPCATATPPPGVLHPLAVLLHRHRPSRRLHPRRPRHRRVRRRGRRHHPGHARRSPSSRAVGFPVDR